MDIFSPFQELKYVKLQEKWTFSPFFPRFISRKSKITWNYGENEDIFDVLLPFYLAQLLIHLKCGYYLRAATIRKVPDIGAATIQGRLLLKGGY